MWNLYSTCVRNIAETSPLGTQAGWEVGSPVTSNGRPCVKCANPIFGNHIFYFAFSLNFNFVLACSCPRAGSVIHLHFLSLTAIENVQMPTCATPAHQHPQRELACASLPLHELLYPPIRLHPNMLSRPPPSTNARAHIEGHASADDHYCACVICSVPHGNHT